MSSDATAPPIIVVEVDPAKVHPAKGNRIVTTELVSDLLPSIQEDGQAVPAILFAHPTLPGEYCAADGNRRTLVARILARTLKAVVLATAPTEDELDRLRVAVNFLQKKETSYELAERINAWMKRNGASQKAAAAHFRLSEPTVSKIVNKALSAIPAVVQAELDKQICPDIGRLLATLPKEKQAQTLEHVLKNGLTRDQLEPLAAQIRGFQRAKPKPVTATDGEATVKIPSGWSLQKVIEFAAKLQDAAKHAMKAQGTIAALPGLLKPAQ
jgi:ParB/RepB/Spo0J family partition protein